MLRVAREARAAATHADAVLLTAAVTWAEQHPPESIDEAATWITAAGDTGIPIAGEGAPLVSEFCIAEFALAIGRSTDAGRSVVADAVELKYRLPRVWARVQSGDLEAWRARRIAEDTLGLTREAAAFVDAQVAPFAHRIGIAALERLVAEAVARFMPDRAAEDAAKAADGRHFAIEHQQVSFNGTSQITGELDLADALDLDAAVTQGAETLKALGSTESLDVRRSHRRRPHRPQPARPRPHRSGRSSATTVVEQRAQRADRRDHHAEEAPKPRQIVLYVHLSEEAITGTSNGLELARVENQRQVVTADQIRTWCANPDAQVVVKPVIDLNEHIHVEGYEVPARLREQAVLRDHRRNLGSHATPWLSAVLASISSSISAGVRNPWRLRGLELSSAAMLSSMPGP